MKYYFPLHLNGDNRGCEAIAKGTALLLDEPKENLVGLCTNSTLDIKLGLSDYITLVDAPSNNIISVLLRKLHRVATPQKTKHMKYVYSQMYDNFINNVPMDSVVLSTGGDMFCYGNNEAVYTSEKCQSRGLKTILWACSIGEKNLTSEKLKCLHNFDLIYVRESLTYNLLLEYGLKNVINFPDPAFCLEPKSCVLPNCFEKGKQIVGVNISNFVLSEDPEKEIMILNFVEYIFNKTNYDILLIPHVLWSNQDDRIPSKSIYEKYYKTNRIYILDTKRLNYCEIRYVISKCHAFIGARTHSVISAYSTCVPTIALGYSVKSKGLAKDLDLSEKLVINCTKDIYPYKLIESFIYLEDHYKDIKEHLEIALPKYVSKLTSLKSEILKYI